MSYILAHDLGTSGDKATLFEEGGAMISSCTVPYGCHFFNGNWAEQDPDEYWKAFCSSTKALAETIDASEIAVVSFSGQMMACLCVDEEGNALRPSIIWADLRAAEEAKEIRQVIDDDRFYAVSGHRNSASYGIQKFAWVRKNEPDVYARTYKTLNCKDYVVQKLTGVFATDYSDGTSMAAVELDKYRWSGEILDAAGIDMEKMPELHASTDVIGTITKEAAALCGLLEGTPVVIGGGDGVTAAAGAGSTRVGRAYCCLGSSAWISYAAEKPLYDKKQRTFSWPSMKKGLFNPCGSMQAAGLSYSWMRDNICLLEKQEAAAKGQSVYDLINQQIETSPVGANGIVFLPYLMGERSPWWNPDAVGTFHGLRAQSTRADLLRAVVEGVSLNMAAILELFREYQQIDELTLIGGGAKSATWMKILADCLGTKILRPNHIEEAGSMGAAIAGGVGVGLYDDFSVIDRFLEISQVIDPDQENHEKYLQILETFKETYLALSTV